VDIWRGDSDERGAEYAGQLLLKICCVTRGGEREEKVAGFRVFFYLRG
jgi:hypothetical protein